ncbi:hypothetical protein FIV00_13150 [Labrenzia sp. THAF82]|uniref:PepSY domain-containing protein n=1 Tax=Labrenzia sp. THAF82 TaxID=2587861 RepID=UPI0012A7D00D|nr:PepSY domain-containing protein [Labrenzia sp. THAF82]QFT31434.1 hypothetical protein FIV00_13150 [Labrenzia sp. THAF82]
MSWHSKSVLFAVIVTASFALPTGGAIAAVTVGDKVGTTEEDIRAALTDEGYVVEEIEIENGEVEAEVSRDGQEIEVVVDGESGLILEMELEETDKDEDED